MDYHEGSASSTGWQPYLQPVQDAVWLLLVILTPLWVNLWGQQPFELPKVALMRTLVWLLACLVVADHILARRRLGYTVQDNPLAGAVGVLALVIAVSTLTAVNRRLSLWGSYERAQGAVTLLTYCLLCLLAATRFDLLARARKMIVAMVATSVPVILLSIAQALGSNPLGLVSDARSPVYATLGRANFVAAYLVILGPLTLALLMTTRHRAARVAMSALLTGQLAVIGLTASRGAWAAAAVAFALFGLVWWGPRLARRWHRVAWTAVGLLFLSGPVAVLALGQRQVGSTAARLAIWKSALALLWHRPMLGFGADALGSVFPLVYPPELVYFQGRDVFVDRAHTLPLEWALVAGLPGLLAFSLVILTFVFVVHRALREPHPPERRALLCALLAAVTGNVANTLVSFDVTPTATASWFLMGVAMALVGTHSPRGSGAGGKQPAWRWATVAFLFVVCGIAIGHFNVRPMLADVAARTATRHDLRGDGDRAVMAAQRAVAYWPEEPAHHLLQARIYQHQASASPDGAAVWLARAEGALRKAVHLRPGDPMTWLHLAEFYTFAAGEFGGNTRELSEWAYGRALALAPAYATIYTAWGRAYLDAADPESAAPLLRQAVILDATQAEAYLYLGAAELALGRVDVALADYQEAVRLRPESGSAYAGLAKCYWQLGRTREALWAVEAALRRAPANMEALALREVIVPTP